MKTDRPDSCVQLYSYRYSRTMQPWYGQGRLVRTFPSPPLVMRQLADRRRCSQRAGGLFYPQNRARRPPQPAPSCDNGDQTMAGWREGGINRAHSHFSP